MQEFFDDGKWLGSRIHADKLYKMAKSHYGSEEKAEELRLELMKFRMDNKRDALTGESLE